jgi:hypothetical protein
MVPNSVLTEVEEFTKAVEYLEEEQRILNFKIMALISPYLDSPESCEVLLDYVPCGYVGSKVRQALENSSCTK